MNFGRGEVAERLQCMSDLGFKGRFRPCQGASIIFHKYMYILFSSGTYIEYQHCILSKSQKYLHIVAMVFERCFT